MQRRRLLIAAAASLTPPIITAQVPGRTPRVGFIVNSAPLADVEGEHPAEPFMREFLRGLRDAGYVEGVNVVIERRTAEGNLGRLEGIARELAESPVDVIVVSGNAATRAAMKATQTIPIVSAGMATPVELGFVASLARPGGNLTGLVQTFAQELSLKRVELLRQLVPTARRIAWFASSAVMDISDEVRALAESLRLTIMLVDARLPRIEAGLDDLARQGADAVIVAPQSPLYAYRRAIVELAARHRLPDIYGIQEAVEAGGLAAYGIDGRQIFRGGARYVGRILRGAKPGELPVEQVGRYVLALNKRRARALGIAIPPSLLQRADEVID